MRRYATFTKHDISKAKAKLKMVQVDQEKINRSVNDWYLFSTTPRTEDEIKERVLHDKKYGTNTICISYICKFSKLSEEMIDWLCEKTRASINNNAKSAKYSNKVDWDYISSYQVLSEEFIEKHSKEVNWGRIFQFQKLSREFKKKHMKDFSLELEIEANEDE